MSLDATGAIYPVSPECFERRCSVSLTYDNRGMTLIYQHGKNPEAVLKIDRYSYHRDPAEQTRRTFRAWAERVHRHDDGVVPRSEEKVTA